MSRLCQRSAHPANVSIIVSTTSSSLSHCSISRALKMDRERGHRPALEPFLECVMNAIINDIL
jgi:hypothetical protein